MKLLNFFTLFVLIVTVQILQADEKKEKEKDEVTWKTYSKNKSYTYIDHKAKTGSEEDTFNVYKNESFMEGSYKNFSLGGRKTLIVFTNKDFDPSVAEHDYKYSNELLNHSWEHWLDRIYFKGND